MNTTEIITKLRAQAAELTAMADALEAASSHNGAGLCPRTGVGRYLIHGAVKVGDWTTYEGVPLMALAEDRDGDCFVKSVEGRTWVLDGKVWRGADSGASGSHAGLMDSLSRCRILALGLTGIETADEIRNLVERIKQVPA